MSEWHRFHRRQHESVNEWMIWPGKWLDLGPIKLIEICDFAGPRCMWATERDIAYVQLQALDIAALSSLLLCSFTTWSKELEIFHKNPESDFCPQHQWHSDKSQTEKSHCLKWSILSAASKSRNYHICTNPISLGNTAAESIRRHRYQQNSMKHRSRTIAKGLISFTQLVKVRGGNLVWALPSIRFSWNFYQIISGTKYE